MTLTPAVALVKMVLADEDAVHLFREALGIPPAATQSAALAYTVNGLAARCGVSPKTVRGAIHRGELEASRRGTGSRAPFIIAASAADDWLARGRPSGKTDIRRRATGSQRAVHKPLATAMAALNEPQKAAA